MEVGEGIGKENDDEKNKEKKKHGIILDHGEII